MDGEEELERCFRDYHFYGLKMNGLRFGYSTDRHSLIDPYLKICEEYDKMVVGHAMSDLFSLPAKWEEMARTFPKVVFVLAHIGIPLMADDAFRIAKRNPNVYLNTAIAFEPVVKQAIEKAGPEKVVLGSDAPFGSMSQHIEIIKRSTTDEVERAMILGENMNRIFKF